MAISRRRLLRGIGAGVVGAAGAPSLAGASMPSSGAVSWSAAARGRGGPIRLHRNENPYGPSPKVLAALRAAALASPERYPGVDAARLRSAIAAEHRVTADHVVLGCGSSEILRVAAQAFLDSRGKLVAASPTFDWFSGSVLRAGTVVVRVPLTSTYAHDLDAMLARGSAAAALVYICNPHNPTGTLTPRRDLEAFIRRLPAITRVVIDEAYHHYVDPSEDYVSFLDRPLADPRVIVVRSFSKIHGLAGLRVGYAVAAPETARRLRRHLLPDNVNVVAARAALAALKDAEHVRMSVARTADDRQDFYNEANARMVRAIDSHTSFVLVDTARPAAHAIEHFKAHDILLPPPYPDFPRHVRVSLGRAEDMVAFWRVWDRLPGGGHTM